MDRVRELLPAAPVLYADETPARAAGKLRYVHVACTEFLTAMHTGGRTSEAIDSGGILPGYPGTIVRDGYKGYEHLTGALHGAARTGSATWPGCTASTPTGRSGPRSMADLLIDANAKAGAARAAGQATLSDAGLAGVRSWYRGAVAKGIRRQRRQAHPDRPGRGQAGPPVPRPRGHDPAVRHRPGRRLHLEPGRARHPPVKVQQRSSGGTWRTLLGLADFAIVASYLSTTAKWGIDALDALTMLFTSGPWLPPAAAPP